MQGTTLLGTAFWTVCALLIGVFAYLITARLDKRSRDLDLFEKQIEKAAEKIGELHVWADIKNELQHPSEVVVTSDKVLPFYSCFRSKDSRYIVMPIPLFEHMPSLWKARMGSLMEQARTLLDAKWPQYWVTVRDANPPHRYTKDPLLG